MKKTFSEILGILKRTYADWKDDNASRLAASLAYYTIFSLAPLLVIAIAVAGFVWSHDAVEAQVMSQVRGLVGTEGARFVGDLISSASNPAEGILATIIGIITLLFGALGVFNELHTALNVIWEVEEEKSEGFLGAVKKAIFDRFLSFTMVLGIGFLLLVSLVVSAGLSATQEYVGSRVTVPEFLLQLLNLVISIGVGTLLFAMIYKFLPDIEIAWRSVWLGAFVTAVLFALGKLLIGLYLGNSAIASSFGAAGSLVLLLVWVYYSAQILFFGAEFTQAYANTYGTKQIPPTDTEPARPAKSKAEQAASDAAQVPTPKPKAVPVPYAETLDAQTELENKQVAQFLLGLTLMSFVTGLLTSIFGIKKK